MHEKKKNKFPSEKVYRNIYTMFFFAYFSQAPNSNFLE